MSDEDCRIYGSVIWSSRMKTTLDMDDDLMKRAKIQAAADGVPLRAFVEEALRARLLPAPASRKPFRLALPIVEGKGPPAVDIADRDALYDLMEGD
jgi:Arc/MetJ family transcription regulator